MLYGENRTNTNGYRYQRTLDAPTQKLFKAIDDENLEDFRQAIEEGADVYARDEKGMTPLMIIARARVYDRQQPVLKEMVTLLLFKAIDDGNLEDFKEALAEGADVNAFDEEGMTPLMSIVNICTVSGDGQATLEKMAKLLIQKKNIDINAQSQQFASEERWNIDRTTESIVSELGTTSNTRKDTALHIACQVGAKDMVKILLTHPDIETDIRNYEYKSSVDCIARGFEDTIKLELERARKGRELLDALSSGNIHQAKRLLNQELNPNCWKRTYNEEIETPLSLIIESCLRGIIGDNEEVLTKLLKHKDLDFSQIKPIQDIEKNPWVKQIIEQAITERLTDTINRKDLDDVKKLVEDNCFMNYAIIIAAWRNVNNPIESIVNYLNEKFPANTLQPLASTNDIPVGSEQVIQELKGELERTKAQLTETEQELANKTSKISQLKRDLKQVREERDRLSSEIRTKSLSNKNEKSSQAISPGKKQSNYASASFVLSGAFAVGVLNKLCQTTSLA